MKKVGAAKNQKRSTGTTLRAQSAAEFGAVVAEAIARTKEVQATVPGLVVLNAAEKRRLAKPRAGSEKHVDEMAIAAREFPDYVPAGIDPDTLSKELIVIQDLRSLQVVVAGFLNAVEDTLSTHSASAWSSAQRQVSKHPDLMPVLESMAAFLARPPAHAAVVVPEPVPAVGVGVDESATTPPVA